MFRLQRWRNSIAVPWKAIRLESFVHSEVSLWICRWGNRVQLGTCKSQNEDNPNLWEERPSKVSLLLWWNVFALQWCWLRKELENFRHMRERTYALPITYQEIMKPKPRAIKLLKIRQQLSILPRSSICSTRRLSDWWKSSRHIVIPLTLTIMGSLRGNWLRSNNHHAMMIVDDEFNLLWELRMCKIWYTLSTKRFDVQSDDVHYRIYWTIVEYVLKCTSGVLAVKPGIHSNWKYQVGIRLATRYQVISHIHDYNHRVAIQLLSGLTTKRSLGGPAKSGFVSWLLHTSNTRLRCVAGPSRKIKNIDTDLQCYLERGKSWNELQ